MGVAKALFAALMCLSISASLESSSSGEFPRFKVGDTITCIFNDLNHGYEIELIDINYIPRQEPYYYFTIDVYLIDDNGRTKLDPAGKESTFDRLDDGSWSYSCAPGGSLVFVNIFPEGRAIELEWGIGSTGTWTHDPKDPEDDSDDPK